MPVPKHKTVLFLGTSNHRRSRFAEIFFEVVASKMGLGWRALSRGLVVVNAVKMDASTVKALEAKGIRAADAVARPPIQVSANDFEQADRIVAFNHAEHFPLLQERFPAWAEKVEFWHIDDTPESLTLIEQEVMALVARILGGGNRPNSTALELLRPETKPASEPAKKLLTAKVGRETAGRRGKGVTTVFDLPLSEDKLRELAAMLKTRCGTGGTVKNCRIEIQGDQRDRIVAELEKLGYRVKRAGG